MASIRIKRSLSKISIKVNWSLIDPNVDGKNLRYFTSFQFFIIFLVSISFGVINGIMAFCVSNLISIWSETLPCNSIRTDCESNIIHTNRLHNVTTDHILIQPVTIENPHENIDVPIFWCDIDVPYLFDWINGTTFPCYKRK